MTKEAWKEVIKLIYPDLTDAEFDRMWDDYTVLQIEKRRSQQ